MGPEVDIEAFVLAHEPAIRPAFFVGIVAGIAPWAVVAPGRALTMSKTLRWANRPCLVAMNTRLLRLVVPLAAAGIAAFGAANGWGLLNHFEVPFWIAVPIGVIAMGFAIWSQHAMVHSVPALCRLHRAHHPAEDETDSNVGVNLPWWGRLFGTYRARPRAGHRGMVIGPHRPTRSRAPGRHAAAAIQGRG